MTMGKVEIDGFVSFPPLLAGEGTKRVAVDFN
jgi:hypothetical protein